MSESDNIAREDPDEPVRKKTKLTPREVMVYLATITPNKMPIVDYSTGPVKPDIGQHTSAVVFGFVEGGSDGCGAYYKPGPLSETEKKVCQFILEHDDVLNVRDLRLGPFLLFQYIDQAIHAAEKKTVKDRSMCRIKDHYNIIVSSKPFVDGLAKLPWSEEEHEQICLQLIKDAKDGGWVFIDRMPYINAKMTETGCLTMIMYDYTDRWMVLESSTIKF